MPTGVFFYTQTPAAIIAAVRQFENQLSTFQPSACRVNSERFSPERFRQQFTSFIEARYQRFIALKHKCQTKRIDHHTSDAAEGNRIK
jgi:hypothetical protein